MATTKTLKTASVLAFERKLDPSDALFSSGSWDSRDDSAGWEPIVLREKSVRGTISNRLSAKGQDPAKLNASIQNPNLQTVDVATLPSHADTLKVTFTLRVLAGTGEPSACNDAAYRERLQEVVQAYVATHGFETLAARYAFNLANARFLWRNRTGAEAVHVQIDRWVQGVAQTSWQFDGLALSLRTFEATPAAQQPLAALSSLIADGLHGRQHVLLRITAFVRLGAGQEVFPSQELILDRGQGDKSKTLYQVQGVAGMHSQKLGNALRTIDTWYPGADVQGPIAVEPYGSVTTQGKAYRQPAEKVDFYNLLDQWVLKGNAPSVENQHFVVATLIRGGVFGDAG